MRLRPEPGFNSYMLWIGKAFQSSHAGLPVLLEIFANGKHLGLVRPYPKA